MKSRNGKLAPEPRVEVVRDRPGREGAAFVYLGARPIRGVRGVHPNPDVLVDFLLDAEDRPVLLVLHEPVAGKALAETLEAIVREAVDRPVTRGPRRRRAFVAGRDEVPRILRGFLRGVESLAGQKAYTGG